MPDLVVLDSLKPACKSYSCGCICDSCATRERRVRAGELVYDPATGNLCTPAYLKALEVLRAKQAA